MQTGFWWGDLRERYNLEDRAVDGRIILRCHQEAGWEHEIDLFVSE